MQVHKIFQEYIRLFIQIQIIFSLVQKPQSYTHHSPRVCCSQRLKSSLIIGGMIHPKCLLHCDY